MEPRQGPSPRTKSWREADDPSGGAAFVVDIATGNETYVAEGVHPVWLDDHTLILEHDRCPGPRSVGCGG